jgi:hypothetical protein
MIAKKAMIGDRSIPKENIGTMRRIGANIGSVIFCKIWTRGLYGSGLNHEITARTKITNIINFNIKSLTVAIACIRFAKTFKIIGIPFLLY